MKNKQSIQNSAGICGLFHMPEAAGTLYYMLHAIQHRGSDGAGMAVANQKTITAHKGQGMLAEVFSKEELYALQGNLAVGHIRMKTASDLQQENLQPIMVRAHQGSFALVMDGMLLNGPSLRNEMEEDGLIFQGTTGAEILAHLIQKEKGHLFEKIQDAAAKISGPYAFLLMTKNTMYAVRSHSGMRTLFMARCKNTDHPDKQAYAFASETAAFSLLECDDIQELQPGQMIVLGKQGFQSFLLPKPEASSEVCSGCAMENVYYSRADSRMNGINVHQSRQKAGRLLAKGETKKADIVIGVPDTALSAAAAFAAELKLPYETGLIKNRYIGSTFIQPTRTQRDAGMRVRLNAISSMVKDKTIFLVDDSIQKGSTAARICQLLKEAGARKVHLRIASPIIMEACYFGTEYIPKSALAGASYTEHEMLELFDADSIRFLSLEDFASIFAGKPCLACFGKKMACDLQDYQTQ